MTSTPTVNAFAAAEGALAKPSVHGEAISQTLNMIPTASPKTVGLYIANNATIASAAPTLHELQSACV